MTKKLTIIVMGHIIRMPLGGLVWHYLQYVAGLSRMGHDVYYVEDNCLFEEDEYGWFYNPRTGETTEDSSFGRKFIDEIFARARLSGRWVLHDGLKNQSHGPASSVLRDICRKCDVLINVSGANPVRPMLKHVPRRVLIDTDPAFFQVRVLTNEVRRKLAFDHNAFFTFGENIPTGTSHVPDDGIEWQATRQPVVLDFWPVLPPPERFRATTVMAWDSYREHEEYRGTRYGMKSESFAPYLKLPRQVTADLELALFGSAAPRDELIESGWRLADGGEATRDPWSYRDYIAGSAIEFSVAKAGYVSSNCGWFSERSAAYLASGRPVVVQSTGFENSIKTGEGLISFTSVGEAVDAVQNIQSNYQHHSVAARKLATTYFDSSLVLKSLLSRVLA